jgi:DNA-directed RNA polymerase subunit RPC12/RpoP
MEFKCLICEFEFTENESKVSYIGSGVDLSKDGFFRCPECDSIKIMDKHTGKIQS